MEVHELLERLDRVCKHLNQAETDLSGKWQQIGRTMPSPMQTQALVPVLRIMEDHATGLAKTVELFTEAAVRADVS